MLKKQEKRKRRHRRVRSKIFGTVKVPRLCVFRSSKHIYAQLIDDEKGKTIVSVSDLELNKKKRNTETQRRTPKESKLPTGQAEKNTESRKEKVAIAFEVGKLIAKKAIEKKIKKVVFDRGGYKYHGRIKAVAEGAREGGLKM